AISITNDLRENEFKINQHGKRADAIVKGMLQHSQVGAGEKQLTDLNALTEEYLQLCYYGLRTKDKNYQANLVTKFTPDLSKIEVTPQDLGRVLLNIYNNAFYATQQKKTQLGDQYQPEIRVSTSQQNGSAVIKVRD